ncbi:Pyridoxal-dependent decarboxylase, pyridoxal binding domain containing protein [Amanita muscaria]
MSQVITCSAIDIPTPTGNLKLEAKYHEIIVAKNHTIIKNTQAVHLQAEWYQKEGERLFQGLPPLFYGHPDVYLRNGIIDASTRSAAYEINAEKAFFVADLSEVYRQFQRWKKCLPEIQPFYAIKCNPDPYVLRLLAALGAGFDCASIGEISQTLSLGGVDASRIIFANPCKATSFVRNAGKMGVDLMTFDNVDELYKIARAHPNAKLVVRILADDSKSVCAFGIKFGASLSVIPSLLAKAKELHLDVVGVSFHVGSGCYDPSVYTDAIMRARTVFDMGREAGYKFNLLDVGGGFEDGLFEQVAEVLNYAIEEYFPDRADLRIIGEPGRYFVAKAFRLATNIIARRGPSADANTTAPPHVLNPSGDDQALSVMYYINEGVYGAFNCVLFDHQVVHPYVLSMNSSFHVSSDQPMVSCSVWGPTCDSMDRVCIEVELPAGLRVGDWLGFDNMGAYTICAATRFNGFDVSNVIYTSGGGIEGTELRNVLARYAEEIGYGQ